MNEKFVAGLVTAVAIAPICALCILGPAAIGALFAGAFGWFGDIGPFGTGLIMVVAAGAAHAIYHRRLKRRQAMRDCEDAPIESLSKAATRTLPKDPAVPVSVKNRAFDESIVSKG